MVLKVHVDKLAVGNLFRSDIEQGVFYFGYDERCPLEQAVSLTMPVISDPYRYDYKHQLHPVFDMNLPEGELRRRLNRLFSKAVDHFDDLALLEIVGKSQIGRLRFVSALGDDIESVPVQSVRELIMYDGASGLFESLLERYAVFSGISGIQPKVLLRNADETGIDRITHRDATHIVKSWHENEFPQLAANEFFCMRAAHHAKLDVPLFELSDNGKFLIIKRFDVQDNVYLGFEDFCVLNGLASEQKYQGSYENICKRIKEFVSPEQLQLALDGFFKTLVLSCAVKNGDAHLKNFGVLYSDMESSVRLAPTYDIVSTTPYNPNDTLALLLAGSKKWPKAKMLVRFARQHCNMTENRARKLMDEVAEGVVMASIEMTDFIAHNAYFAEIGERMLIEWQKGLNWSVLANAE